MKQLKLKIKNVKYKFDVVIQNDYNPSLISESFETLDAAIKYRQYLIDRQAVEPRRILIQNANRAL